ncbi:MULTISPECIES: hypothetical protein [Leuconostoc]|uniref:Phage terminase, large subunit n=1 Tax=Leuconostoc inhae TaxID=178001 RepID=A0AAN2QV01_9LACO|nr:MULTISPECIES: hypothetical protein [Leuconostoc]AFS40265.1 hypothetical protein C269_04110 [Leuconostoc gelidum JB7]MBZ5948042.1 hypothetical protein [Leuconostoc gasicomitatum]MBZ5954892.1 hypothetical protein [Leuconostoc gasicomitatum]MBZ5957590.1 hypothetical protein [Leuconostoc gasicomitatum]MBZ5960942.1 hypothetical protein [Leuconostoc gasicomitatum]
MAQPKLKDGDNICLTTKASTSAYGTAFELHKSNSNDAYRVAFWYNNAIVFWNILEQDLQIK